MPSLSANDVSIRIQTTADNTGITQAEQELGNLDKAATKSGGTVGGFFKDNLQAAGVVAAGLVTTLGLAATSALDQAGAYQQSRISFETMLGSADRAKSLLKQMSDFAASTPFELPQVVEGGKKLLAFGVTMEEVIPTFTTLGNIAAGVGTDKLPGLINVFGQVRAAGKLMSQDLLQFTSAGVPVLELLAQHFKKPQSDMKAMVETGKVSFKDLQASLELLGGPTGKWGDLMAKQSQTFEGTLSNVSDQMGRILRQAVGIGPDGDIRKGSLFDVAVKGATALLDGIQKVTPYIEKFTNFIEHNKIAQAALVGVLVGLVALIGAALVAAIGAAIAAAATFAAIAAAVAAVAFLIVTNWGKISSFFTGIWQTVSTGATNTWNTITGGLTYFKDHFFEIMGSILGFWVTLPIKLPYFFALAIMGIIGWFASINWVGVFDGLLTAWLNINIAIASAIINTFNHIRSMDWGSILLGIGRGIGNAIVGMIEGAINGAFAGIPGTPKVKLPRFEKGVRNFGGGMAVVGDVNGGGGEIVNLPKGSDVYTNAESKKMMGGNTTHIHGNIYLGDQSAVDAFFKKLGRNQELAASGLTSVGI
jgi:tape measure domain-containing protein